jgi:CheY-like chemotaxis protein
VELPLVEGQVRRYEQIHRVENKPRARRQREMERSRTILYVEDNLSNLEVVQRLLAPRVRMRLLTAMQGEEGLQIAGDQFPDLILLDIHLPDMTGNELLQRLREKRETSEIPVIVISAEASPGQIRRTLEAGARAYLTKPLDLKKLLELIDEVLA